MADPISANDDSIRAAAVVVRGGGLVAFPTETVYGLGADALNADAVARIFEAKGRPATNPVIVHVSSMAMAESVAELDDRARRLAEALWPGPLTLVLPKKAVVPDVVTAGGPTVGVRMPRHPIALALIEAAGVPIAAPSANRSERLSPTTAQHVAEQLGDRIDMILDGGPTDVGLESTVVDVTVTPARVLRPGMVSALQLGEVLGEDVAEAPGPSTSPRPSPQSRRGSADAPLRSPGQMARHYAPRTPLRIVNNPWNDADAAGRACAILALGQSMSGTVTRVVVLPADAAGYASGLYAALHALDATGADVILVQAPPRTTEWAAIWDRLRRAEAP